MWSGPFARTLGDVKCVTSRAVEERSSGGPLSNSNIKEDWVPSSLSSGVVTRVRLQLLFPLFVAYVIGGML